MTRFGQKIFVRQWTHTMLFSLMGLLAVFLFLADVLIGSVMIPAREGILAVFSPSKVAETTRIIIYDFRLPDRKSVV